MNLKTCPDRDSLQQLLLGKTPRPQAESLEEHLLHCDRCTALADTISANDELTAAIQSPDAAYGEDEIVAQVIQRGKQLRCQTETMETNETFLGQELSQPENAPDASADSPQTNLDEEIDFLAAAEQPDEIGRLGGYRVLEVLGVGGMGVVFRAEDPKLERLIALKAMRPALAASRSAKDRFLREAKSTAAIEHDNIVPIYQVGEDRGVPFIAMQLLRGESLQTCLQREQKLDQRDVLRIGREVADGLTAAHNHGLIHRDIKPDNIWIEAGTGRAKILDFGLVRTAANDAGLTQIGMIIGTPKYMAPEQTQGRPIDHRCDLFSLGSVLYRLVAGKAAFAGNNTTAMLIAVAQHDPEPLEKLVPGLDPDFAALIIGLLQKNPDDRPASAAEVSQRIANIERHLDAGIIPQDATGDISLPPTEIYIPTAPDSVSVDKDSVSVESIEPDSVSVVESIEPDSVSPVRVHRTRLYRIAAAVALTAFAALYFSGVIFKLKTPDGTLVIELDNPQNVVVKTGDGTVLKTNGDRVTISAGGKRTIKAWLEKTVAGAPARIVVALRRLFVGAALGDFLHITDERG